MQAWLKGTQSASLQKIQEQNRFAFRLSSTRLTTLKDLLHLQKLQDIIEGRLAIRRNCRITNEVLLRFWPAAAALDFEQRQKKLAALADREEWQMKAKPSGFSFRRRE